jgi:hypothetical protein
MSRNASSSEIGSTAVLNESNTALTARDFDMYAGKFGATKTPEGQRRRALITGIAERTP